MFLVCLRLRFLEGKKSTTAGQMHQGYSNLDEKRSKEERGRCFILPVTFSVSLPGTFRTFLAGSSGGSWRLACGGWMEVDWLHSAPLAGLSAAWDHSALNGAVITLVSNYLICPFVHFSYFLINIFFLQL